MRLNKPRLPPVASSGQQEMALVCRRGWSKQLGPRVHGPLMGCAMAWLQQRATQPTYWWRAQEQPGLFLLGNKVCVPAGPCRRGGSCRVCAHVRGRGSSLVWAEIRDHGLRTVTPYSLGFGFHGETANISLLNEACFIAGPGRAPAATPCL